MPVRKRSFKAKGGFTLIELMMVILLLSILGAVAAPYLWSGAPAITISALSRKVADDIRYAQELALSRNNLDTPVSTNPYFLYRVRFNVAAPFCADANQYNIASDADNNGSWAENPNGSGQIESARNPVNGESFFCVSLDNGDYAGFTVSADFGGSVPGVVAFDQMGVPYDSDGARISSSKSITVSKGGESEVLTLTPYTGLVVR
ncbi:MAG TPA: hypothetical protein DDW94_03195 [Deltaproteobacteria bacterium]|nr:MAG: hypothetical protein A2Z79_09890 [Deltaproteobacteria bacterium GWA2_55_82]OGQ62489.1 MAG: hypothetical protein A3I81_08385 [Deltaproteobacteria bacterium RIFCSPLOWO2_02_FULL_55_12]OIJ73016.1 MAG: hypothetical protein A2V21_301320 [Deltaproteobacteria bacterium GWC2_55_46]HBG45974.1 hypothetical protein [Deltaproteobacteria bacterium]HCY11808.1 hypothetical protein [Deltaproteobacteria bacterium]